MGTLISLHSLHMRKKENKDERRENKENGEFLLEPRRLEDQEKDEGRSLIQGGKDEAGVCNPSEPSKPVNRGASWVLLLLM